MNVDNPVNISRALCNYRGAVSNYHIPLHCRTGFFICYLNGLIYIKFFSSSVHLVSQQLLGKPLRCFLLTAAGLIPCPGAAGIWIANSLSEQRGEIEKAGLWPLSHFRKPYWLQRIVLRTLATLQKNQNKNKQQTKLVSLQRQVQPHQSACC